MAKGVQFAAFLLILLQLLHCAGKQEPHPSAILIVTPEYVCYGDDHQTVITLDGSQSSAKIHILPELDPQAVFGPVAYEWKISGTEVRIVEGSLLSSLLKITLDGRHVAEVVMTVTDDNGNEATITKVIGLSIPRNVRCFSVANCPILGETCVTTGRGAFCLNETPCSTNGDCKNCRICDSGEGLCMAPPNPVQ